MGKTFEVIDHTADIGIIAYGVDVKHLFSNAAAGMYSLVTVEFILSKPVQRNIVLTADDIESLLVVWLNELIFLLDTEHLFFNKFEFDVIDAVHLRVACFGGTVDLLNTKLIREVKAATYHRLAISNNGNIYKAQVILDI